jgi:hypothetical protein
MASCLRQFALIFFDDILVYSSSFEDHLLHLLAVLQLLERDQWQIKMSKCSFAQQEINYLDHVISSQAVATDPLRACSVLPQSIWIEGVSIPSKSKSLTICINPLQSIWIENNQTSPKVSDIATWPCPRSAKELHSFLGLASYYRKFVRHFGVLSKPLTSLLKKHTIFIWTSVQDQAFQALKEALCFVPVLKLPDFSRSFAIETDACATGIGAVLTQDGHPIAFISKALGPKSQGLSTYEKIWQSLWLCLSGVHIFNSRNSSSIPTNAVWYNCRNSAFILLGSSGCFPCCWASIIVLCTSVERTIGWPTHSSANLLMMRLVLQFLQQHHTGC